MLLRRNAPRRGTTIVESALVLIVFCMLLFGAFEYCRFLYVLHITNNSARDGARYATVNMDKPVSFDATDYTDASGTVHPSVQNYTTARMGGTQKQLGSYRIAVFAVDPVGQAQTPPVIRPKTTSSASPKVYPDPFDPNDTNKVPWNQASFSEGIAVIVDGDYKPLLPTFTLMPSTIHLSVTAVSGSEG